MPSDRRDEAISEETKDPYDSTVRNRNKRVDMHSNINVRRCSRRMESIC
ncbi:b5cd956b-d0b9-4a38-ac9c-caadc239240f-CDS [Sclerotinia trifoliorum]|uniref:B5cd956b-d0b9-4a38-ac9c-caadc239240f-CDS n=1 Tax=Sclerotinia trifoliorum TaxID=28548 RepID=A0A8H2ZPC2_9HELO|nr:b5cd956b-d0b9-4a38-ac9c-caadc239240f-CDS [Sclerotinia trifoliorum]